MKPKSAVTPIDNIHKYFDDLAADYDRLRFGNTYGQFIDALERPILSSLLQDTSPKDTLDLACGTGRFLSFAGTGVDISQNMLDIAQKKYPEKKLIRSSFDNIPVKDQSFSKAKITFC